MESQFTLAPDSRLPRWFALPEGTLRSDVTVELTYYVPPFPVDNAILKLVDHNHRTIAKVTGQSCWHPIMDKKKNRYGGFDPDSYPHYGYIVVNGVLEVFEHIAAPTFRVVDDPMLVKGAIEAKRCDKGDQAR